MADEFWSKAMVKKREYKLISAILALLLILTAVIPLLSGCGKDEFTPVLRFAVASDVHIEDNGTTAVEEARLSKMFDMAYAHAEGGDTPYKKLDAVMFVGDFTNRGTTASMERFKSIADGKLRGETKLVVSIGNHEFYSAADTAVERYEEVFGVEADEHFLLCGFHFIKLSASGEGFSDEKLEWLKRELAEAAADTPKLPIFVMQHQHVKGTVYGSTGWGVDGLYEIFKDYPQVVDFSGHSHFPINDERSIWQGDFTAIGTGTLSYTELGLNGVSTDYVFPYGPDGGYKLMAASGERDYGVFQIVEVDKRGNMRVIGFDVDSGEEIFEKRLDCPAYKRNLIAENEKIEATPVPAFAEGAECRVIIDDGRVALAVPQARSEAFIESYRAEVYDGGELIGAYYALSGHIFRPIPKEVRIELDGIEPSGKYTVKIYAVNAYGRACEIPLEVEL